MKKATILASAATAMTMATGAMADIGPHDLRTQTQEFFDSAGKHCNPIVDTVMVDGNAADAEASLVPCAETQIGYARLLSEYFSQNSSLANRKDFDSQCPQAIAEYDRQTEGFTPDTLEKKQALANFAAQQAFSCVAFFDNMIKIGVTPIENRIHKEIIGSMFCSGALGAQDTNPGFAKSEAETCKSLNISLPREFKLQ